MVADMDVNHKGEAIAPAACLASSHGTGILFSQPGFPLVLLWTGYIFRLQNIYMKERGITPLLNYWQISLSMNELHPVGTKTLSFEMEQEKAACHRKSEALFHAKSHL